MANKTDRFPDNVPGAWYVDTTCIVCGACEATAPDNFKLSDDGSHDVVFRQPTNDDEVQACVEAKEGCPVDAIGSDGEG